MFQRREINVQVRLGPASGLDRNRRRSLVAGDAIQESTATSSSGGSTNWVALVVVRLRHLATTVRTAYLQLPRVDWPFMTSPYRYSIRGDHTHARVPTLAMLFFVSLLFFFREKRQQDAKRVENDGEGWATKIKVGRSAGADISIRRPNVRKQKRNTHTHTHTHARTRTPFTGFLKTRYRRSFVFGRQLSLSLPCSTEFYWVSATVRVRPAVLVAEST